MFMVIGKNVESSVSLVDQSIHKHVFLWFMVNIKKIAHNVGFNEDAY